MQQYILLLKHFYKTQVQILNLLFYMYQDQQCMQKLLQMYGNIRIKKQKPFNQVTNTWNKL